MASLRDFLAEGKLGDIRLGMLPAMVERYLGPADDRSVKRHPVEILKFGSVEFTFKNVPDTDDSRLIAVAVYFDTPQRHLPSSLMFEDWMPTRDTPVAEFRRFLESNGLQVHSEMDGEYTRLALPSGASVVFVEDRLHSLHFRRADKGPPRRQLSVSLPEETLRQLRERAQRENISVQELLERVLSTTI